MWLTVRQLPIKSAWRDASLWLQNFSWSNKHSFISLQQRQSISIALFFRRSHTEVFLEKGVLKICSKFTWEHPCQSIEITPHGFPHGFSPVNLLHIFRTPFPKNTSGRLLLKIITWHITCYMNLVEALIRHQKFHLACRESPTIALSHHVRIKENH